MTADPVPVHLTVGTTGTYHIGDLTSDAGHVLHDLAALLRETADEIEPSAPDSDTGRQESAAAAIGAFLTDLDRVVERSLPAPEAFARRWQALQDARRELPDAEHEAVVQRALSLLRAREEPPARDGEER